ncbi:hypothetical protein M426DRAFT_16773 [Hypoxylon sp. CI-4A]|nr:hypothetical protein M426DRAFT_16773 [Hypoxylon sp. CI-4A]
MSAQNIIKAVVSAITGGDVNIDGTNQQSNQAQASNEASSQASTSDQSAASNQSNTQTDTQEKKDGDKGILAPKPGLDMGDQSPTAA